MKHQRTNYGAEGKRSSIQQIRVLDMNRHTGPMHLALVGLMADEMWVEIKIFKIPYKFNYSDFYCV